MKSLLLCLSICLCLSSCDQLQKGAKTTDTVTYSQLTAQKNYWDSIPGKIKVRDHARPYRYYLNDDPYTGKIEDYFAPGKPKLIGTFKDGYAEGLWKYYQENDSLEQTGSFENGYVTGEWRFYDRKGKEDTRLIYKVKNHLASADTLMVVYPNGIRKEWQKDKIVYYYKNGLRKSEMSRDQSAGKVWNEHGKLIGEMTDFIYKDLEFGLVTYYIAKGKHTVAMNALLKRYHWTDQQKPDFQNANKVRISASGNVSISSSKYSLEVVMD